MMSMSLKGMFMFRVDLKSNQKALAAREDLRGRQETREGLWSSHPTFSGGFSSLKSTSVLMKHEGAAKAEKDSELCL